MALQPRHRWMVSQVVAAFKLENEEAAVEFAFRGRFSPKIEKFLSGASRRQHLLFAFHQGNATPSSPGALNSDVGLDAKLICTDGAESGLQSRSIYFLKTTQRGKAVNLNVASDGEVIFGEIAAAPLASLDVALTGLFLPIVEKFNEKEWKCCPNEQRRDFVGSFRHFCKDLSDAIQSLSCGIELTKPDPAVNFRAELCIITTGREIRLCIGLSQNFTSVDMTSFSREWNPESCSPSKVSEEERADPAIAAKNHEVVLHFENLLEDWCRQIERFLETSLDQSHELPDAGPRSEIEYWRSRMQRLNSIIEQLKSDNCRLVFQTLYAVSKTSAEKTPKSKQTVFHVLRRCKQIDTAITEAFNEAKDNVKYLSTLRNFMDPLYTGTPQNIIDNLGPLMNAVTMVHSISRHYNTTERMTNFFVKITNQMICNCKKGILADEHPQQLWEREPEEIIRKLEACSRLNDAYHEQYRITKDKLLTTPKGKQFDFSEHLIFGRMDLFCRRVLKLITLFSIIRQFQSISRHCFEGMGVFVERFQQILAEFRSKRHDMLDFTNNRFDRDFVEFTVRVADLESALQPFINQSFASTTSIDASLQLLKKFQSVVHSENLKSELKAKISIIFHRYGWELQQVQQQYERLRANPPIDRAMPPVAGSITWARHLLKRIEGPMKKFEEHPFVLNTREAKKTVRLYNKVAATLVEFELRWHQAWKESVPACKAGLQAPLLARHASSGQLFVNFDPDLVQLLREAKALDRLRLDLPEDAKIVLLRERKLKKYYEDLTFVLMEYRRIASMVRPITAALVQPHLDSMEQIFRPGTATLTWTSMNIDSYLQSIYAGLAKLEQLVTTINDIVENRIDSSLLALSRVRLVDVPTPGEALSLQSFVELQENYVKQVATLLNRRSAEIEGAVHDLLRASLGCLGRRHTPTAYAEDIVKVKAQYKWNLYTALLTSTKNSLLCLKERLQARRNGAEPPAPFFEVDLQLDGQGVRLHPSLEEIQKAVNSSALAILMCSKKVKPWTLSFSTPHSDAQSADATLDAGEREAGDAGQGESFHSRIAQDREILKILLLLTGSIQSTRDEVTDFLGKFDDFAWLWTDSARDTYAAFAAQKPSLDEFEKKIRFFVDVETKLQNMQTTTAIGVLQLNSSGLISQLTELVRGWSLQFLDELHQKARQKLETLTEHIRQMSKRLKRTVSDIDALRHVMETLNYIREKESDVESEFGPIISMYNLLDRYLPSNVTLTDKDEHDQRLMLRSSWLRLLEDAQTCQDNLIGMQTEYKRELIVNINSFKADVKQFRDDFEKNGPAALGIAPREAVERVRRFKEECEMRTRKQEIYYAGEDLFGFPHQSYPELDQTKKEISHLTLLYDLYVQVIDTMKEWKEIHWTDAPGYMPLLTEKIQFFSTCCKKLPKQLKDSDAYLELKKEIDDFIEILPLLEELSKKSIMPRHWKQVEEITGKSFNVENEMLRLQTLTDAGLLQFKDDIVDICDSADKQLIIEEKLSDIEHAWKQTSFDFGTWKTRDYPCVLQGGRVAEIQEALEESQMSLNTMNAMRHVAPFKERVVNMLTTLSDVSDTIDSWTKVQVLWTSLEPVFTGGDIAKQMPAEAKRFHGIDKDWTTIMSKAAETATVVECCQNELLKQLLPVLHGGLESCQKSLESYLEGKRNKFPRFYFVSNPVLLKILSQGSDADSVQEDFEKLFDAISRVVFDKEDRKKIVKIKTVAGSAEEVVTLSAPLKVEGNIEDWLKGLEVQMQRSIRRDCKYAAHETALVGSQLSLRDFCDRYIAQVALLGLQMVWTTDCHEALEKLSRERDKSIMNATNKKFVAMMTDLVAACLSDLGTQLNRTKYETLVTIHVHQRDVFADLWKKVKEHRLRDSSDFEWLKQTRLYWKTDTDNALIAIADVDFTYSYEYLGVKERLAITPLTDRCYLTCSQALGMFYGGAPAGPAGTGKTETVKDMGRTLGVFVVVTNCSDQHRYNDMAKIFKGLCQSGLWGCFDEFNRIDLEVLSVVAMQIESITTAKKQGLRTFMFPGEAAPIRLVPATAYFITMNPGYAGRQELPENLKVLFRSVSMMVPDRQIIIKVKLASVGYLDIDNLSKKFKVLYGLCEEQLSKQRHYDFGLRNILSVLRTAGATKRTDPDADEEMLLMRTLRDMNLSKLVADDVPLFLSLLRDIFPKQADPPKKLYSEVESAVVATIAKNKLLLSDEFLTKVMQLYETSTVRHGFMLVGPTCSGKSEIASTLATALTSIGIPTRSVVMNPKAITAQQMYGVKDPLTEEWTPGIFAWLWAKYNNRALKFNTWLTCDGPVDAIWIENLNTVLDDNKILTLANNDRIPMTENTRIVFEVENLNNASPATVSRAGIVYVSATDVGWKPLVLSWLNARAQTGPAASEEKALLTPLFEKYLFGANTLDFALRELRHVMPVSAQILTVQVLNLLAALLRHFETRNEALTSLQYERVLTYALTWGVGGLLETEDRLRFDAFLKSLGAPHACEEGLTLFDYWVELETKTFQKWSAREWTPPPGSATFSSILAPTTDSERAEYLVTNLLSLPHSRNPPSFQAVLLVGGPGTAKTSTALMFFSKYQLSERLWKRVNLSSATTPERFQQTVEAELERKTGKTYCPPGGKQMTLFLDDMSMPFVNAWGDQVTLELGRQLIEQGGMYFLDKDKRGDFKTVIGMQYLGAMNHPGGGRNDIPNRLKSKFFSFNMILPSLASVDNIYGAMLRSRFTPKAASPKVVELSSRLTKATIDLWLNVKKTLLPTPNRFHYVFNMRDLSRVFQGVLSCPLEVLTSEERLVGLWKNECLRVFADKLSREVDKQFVHQAAHEVCSTHFGRELAKAVHETPWFADFLREGVEDESGELLPAPKIYEPVPSLDVVRAKVNFYLEKYNEDNPSKQMNLVMFDAAVTHLMAISRIIQMPRGSAMLVGVGGSGKQSLARLAAYIAGHFTFQITVTKTYNDNALFDDLRCLYASAGQKNQATTFLLTDLEIKSEGFLEYFNSLLSTGEVAGLFAKDERDNMVAERRADFIKERPNQEENLVNLYNFFMDRVRDNLHVVLCFSPLSSKFAERAQKFPALFSTTIDWFLPWPEDALVAVSSRFLHDFEIDASPEKKATLFSAMGRIHTDVGRMCEEYFLRMRRHVYVTPKSYLSFLSFYKLVYAEKFKEVNNLEHSVNVGLLKLNQAAQDIKQMKVKLKDEEKKLRESEEQTNQLLVKVQSESAKAQKKSEQVGAFRDECLANKERIEVEQEEANRDLQQALPYLQEAENAVKSITAKDIVELKTMKTPSDIIRLVFDGVMILLQTKLVDVRMEAKVINKKTVDFIHDSFDETAKAMMADVRFLSTLFDFSKNEKDNINDETCELLMPYLELENFNPAVAKKASNAAEGLCKWVGAMVMYHEAAKIVKPKMDYLKIQTARVDVALRQLAEAEAELAQAQATLRDINKQFEAALSAKTELEQRALATKRKMDQANKLINGLAGEKTRWTEDSNTFAERRKKLVGDITVVAGFVSYCGPFNAEYRMRMRKECFGAMCKRQGIPASEDVNIVEVLVDQGTIGEWNLQGLPADELSVQNAILVTRSSRYALMVDPQGQALNWIKKKEEGRMQGAKQCLTTMSSPRLKDQLEYCLQEGKPILIEGVTDDVNPLIDPILEKQILRKGKKLFVNLSDQLVEFNPDFTLYLTTKLANPHFSPELSAKCTVIDFTVTQEGLEQQLLGRVLSMEQRSLEESLNLLMEEVTSNTKALQALDDQLLERLSKSQGNLLDDTELIEVLGNTKAKAKEVEKKLKDAQEKKLEINEKREQYRPVATRGSVLYFCMVEMSLVCWMYNSSLAQFLEQFDLAIHRSEKAQPTHKRVERIVDALTYQVYRYVNRGLFERHKTTFLMMVATKVLLTAGELTSADVSLFLTAGAGLDEQAERPCPYKWLGQDSKTWLNILQLSRHSFGHEQIQFFCELPDIIGKNEAQWRKFLEDNEPEKQAVPDFEERIRMQKPLGPFIRLCLLRALREDRTVVASARCIEALLDPRYTEPVTDSVESIWQESHSRTPVLFLLSPGTDPTAVIDELAKKKKKFPTDKVSMGEGQEIVAREKIKNGFLSGGWVVLQNCHLGLNFMSEIEELLLKVQDVAKDFRLWITCESHNRFPIGLLQMSIKVTNEPPIGLKAGLHRTFTTMVTQETLDKVDHEKWRNIVFATAFLHSIVQERRKFGPLGWCVPYEFNYSDLEASLFVIEKHLASTILVGQPLSWSTICYMVAEVQYGGRITDDLDRELFNTYTSKWFTDELFKHNFSFTGNAAGQHDFQYRIPDCLEIAAYREYINTLPAVDQPSVFGLHVNADLTFRLQESSYMLKTIQETQPKDSRGGGGKSREEAVKEKCQEILSKMPPDFVEEQYREQISKLSSPPGLLTKGLQVPLNIFLFQEVQRMQRIIALSRKTLMAVIDAIDGLIIMTPDLQDDVNLIFDMRVPKKWLRDPSGAEISWISSTLGKWFSGMQLRVEQLVSWLQNGRPKSFWLSGFFNPEGFLTGMMQEVTRQHKKDQWGLDDVVLHTEVKGYDYDKVKETPDEGVNIHGLYIEGSRWNWHEGKLDESLPKVMVDRMPILYVTAVTSKDKKNRSAEFGQFEPYDCPVYKYPKRTDNYLVFRVNLRTEVQPSHWKLRGTALLCSIE